MYYYTGKPCKRGHLSKRQSLTGNCAACNLLRQRKLQKEEPERNREYLRKWRKKNPEAARKIVFEYKERNGKRLRQET